MLKKIAVLAATLITSSGVLAAGPNDGIYINPTTGGYFSVHTNGAVMIAIGLNAVPASNLQFTTALGVVRVNSVATWEVATGTTDGASATLTGANLYGACYVTYSIAFGPGVATARIVGASQTLTGQQSGINCAALTATPPTTLPKAF